jgi:hypothetical protein
MIWNDRIVSDDSLSKGAKKLAGLIVEKYAANTVLFCSMADSECAAALDTNIKVIRAWRRELETSGYLVPLYSSTSTKPFFAMRPGHPVQCDDMENST